MVAHSSTREVWLPHVGVWNKTSELNMPAAGSTHLGLWLDTATSKVGFCCVFFFNADDEGVDPDEEDWDHFRFYCRQGDRSVEHDTPVTPPDYWAECRFVIPG